MAPPKVDLSSKEAQKKMEEAEETKVPMDAPVAMVTQPQPRCQRRKRNCALGCVLTVAVVIVVIAIAFTFKFAMRLRRHHQWTCSVVLPDRHVPENVRVDEANQLIYIKTPATPKYHAVEALHDYNSKWIAFKDTTKMRCFIDKMNTTFDHDYDRWADRENHDHVPEPRFLKAAGTISPDVLHRFGGRHISAHCRGVQTRWVVEVTKEEAADGNWEASEHVVRMVYGFDLKIRIDIKTDKK